MSGLVNIGFGNMIHPDKLVAIVSPDAAPVKRMISAAKDMKKCIDATQGRKTKAVLVMEDQYIVLSALAADTIARRFAPVPEREIIVTQGNGQKIKA